jgi:hypothetical protein
MTMKNQVVVAMQLPFDLNPLTWLWCTISSYKILCHYLLEYLKLVEIDNIFVLGSVEFERCFFTFKFLKFSLCNSLGVHLPMVVSMF